MTQRSGRAGVWALAFGRGNGAGFRRNPLGPTHHATPGDCEEVEGEDGGAERLEVQLTGE